MSSSESTQAIDGPFLSAPDAAALDALVDGGYEPARVDAEHRARALKVARLLARLGVPAAAEDRTLTDVTMARVMRASGAHAAMDGPATLSPDDAEALDAWVLAGYDASRVPASLRERAHRHEGLAALAAAPSAVAASAGLVAKTLARVQAEEQLQVQRMDFQGAADRGRGLRLSDLISVAAVLLLSGAVVWPVLASVREQGRREVCLANLGSTGSAMAAYAGTYRDSLPISTASLGGGKFWDVGAEVPHSNSANLYTLARDGYTSLANLACPGNPFAPTKIQNPQARDWRTIDEVSYSYQIMFGQDRPRWNSAQATPVLADRSPVIIRLMRHEPADPYANAANHRSAGQHLLFTDGTVRWLTSPQLPGGDNIWLPRPFEQRLDEVRRGLAPGSLSGTETPAAADDTFLGP